MFPGGLFPKALFPGGLFPPMAGETPQVVGPHDRRFRKEQRHRREEEELLILIMTAYENGLIE